MVGIAIIVLLLGYGLLGVTLAKRSDRTEDGEAGHAPHPAVLTEHYQFGDVHVTVWPHRQHLVTTFPDGTTVDACPQPTVAYRNHALALGYTGLTAAWQMCRDHELAHTFLAHRNHTVSPALWAVAHGATVDTDEIRDEEAWVLAFQQACRRKPWAEAHRTVA